MFFAGFRGACKNLSQLSLFKRVEIDSQKSNSLTDNLRVREPSDSGDRLSIRLPPIRPPVGRRARPLAPPHSARAPARPPVNSVARAAVRPRARPRVRPLIRLTVGTHVKAISSWRPPSEVDSLTSVEQDEKRQKLSDALSGMLRARDQASNIDLLGNTNETRRSAFEWCVAYQNGMTEAIGYGLERCCLTKEQLVKLTDCLDWECQGICGDNGGDQTSAVQAINRSFFFLFDLVSKLLS